MIEEIKTVADLNAFNAAILDAVNTAAMYDETEDGGSSNFDAVAVKIKIPAKLAARVWAGLEKMLTRNYGRIWRGCYLVDIPLSGQGNRRTRMARAAADVLKAAGYQSLVYYQLD